MADPQPSELQHIDSQIQAVRTARDAPMLSEAAWPRVATDIHNAVVSLESSAKDDLRQALMVPPDRYVEELSAFQGWIEIAHQNRDNPFVVRAQVMTELYVSFVWLKDSVMKPASEFLLDGTFDAVETFLRTGQRRLLRNAIAHGRWCYLPDFSGLEYWAEPSRHQPHERFEIDQRELGLWQVLSRGTAIAVLLGLTEAAHPGGGLWVPR